MLALMIHFFTFLFALCSLSGMLGAQTLMMASYNVENLFDMHDDGTEYVEYVPGHHGWSEAMLQKKLRNITEVICDLEADVVALQEVENDRILARLQKSLKRSGCPYPYRAITSDLRVPIHNAFLSKVRLKRTRDVHITRYGRQRSILEVVLDTTPPLRLFNNHWRSKRGPESERVVYAKALIKRLHQLPAGTEYLLLGDFNSNYNETHTIDAKHNDTHNVTGINTILHTMVSGKMVRLNTLHGDRHCTLWMELPAGERWSHNFFGDKEGIDAMVIPPALHDGKGWEYRPGSFRVFRPHYLFGKRGRVNRWAYRHRRHVGKGYSDHLPILATLTTDGYATATQKKKTDSWWQRWIGKKVSDLPESTALTPATSHTADQDSAVYAEGSIARLKTSSVHTKPLSLRNVHVLFKRRDSAVIQQKPDGEAILVYRSALQLEAGHCYDIVAYKTKRYQGMDELTDIEVAQRKGACDVAEYIAPFSPEIMGNRHWVGRVVRDAAGVYMSHTIRIKGRAVPIHFQKRAGHPKNGDHVLIRRALVGYYRNHMELQIWDKRDYTVR